jgi:hypothetical protein
MLVKELPPVLIQEEEEAAEVQHIYIPVKLSL